MFVIHCSNESLTSELRMRSSGLPRTGRTPLQQTCFNVLRDEEWPFPDRLDATQNRACVSWLLGVSHFVSIFYVVLLQVELQKQSSVRKIFQLVAEAVSDPSKATGCFRPFL